MQKGFNTVPIETQMYCERKTHSNMELIKSLLLFGIQGNIIVLDHFRDATKTTLNTIPMLLEFTDLRPEQIFTANIGVKPNGEFAPTQDSAKIIELAKSLGVEHAAQQDVLTYLSKHGRIFSAAYFDMCCSFAKTKPILLTFIANHLDVSKEALIAFTVEMHRTMHRDGKFSNNELIREFVFGELKSVLPFTFRDPMIWINEPDISNTMQFVVIKLTPAMLLHQSHLAFNARDCKPTQVLFLQQSPPSERCFVRGTVHNIGKPAMFVEWSSNKITNTIKDIPWQDVRLLLPAFATVDDEIPILDHSLLKQKVVKKFHGVKYTGEVKKAYRVQKHVWFLIKYEDGDSEEMTAKEVLRYCPVSCKRVKR